MICFLDHSSVDTASLYGVCREVAQVADVVDQVADVVDQVVVSGVTDGVVVSDQESHKSDIFHIISSQLTHNSHATSVLTIESYSLLSCLFLHSNVFIILFALLTF
jgi:hypothetical protein